MIIFVSGRPADPHLRAAVATKIARQKESAIEAATAKALEVSVCVCVFVCTVSERPKTQCDCILNSFNALFKNLHFLQTVERQRDGKS